MTKPGCQIVFNYIFPQIEAILSDRVLFDLTKSQVEIYRTPEGVLYQEEEDPFEFKAKVVESKGKRRMRTGRRGKVYD